MVVAGEVQLRDIVHSPSVMRTLPMSRCSGLVLEQSGGLDADVYNSHDRGIVHDPITTCFGKTVVYANRSRAHPAPLYIPGA
jgi:hypothetical protein